ncbi:MAG: hypothetical protein AAF151_15755 [Cyanobacteria bacterium J06656_5]
MSATMSRLDQNASMANTDATTLLPGQKAFIASIENQVNELLGSQLDGTFNVVNRPAGFNYITQYSQPPVYNEATLRALDGLLTVGTNGVLTLGDEQFSTTYFKILSAASYQLSASDRKVNDDPNIQAQTTAVINTAQSSGYVAAYSVTPLTYSAVTKSVIKEFGSSTAQDYTTANISAAAKKLAVAGYQELGQAISNGINQTAPLIAILNKQDQATQELQAAQTNTQNPSADNGGLKTGEGKFYVGYQNMPSPNQVLGGLQSQSKVSIKIQASNFSSTETHFSISGSTGFSIPIGYFFAFGFGGSASYNMSKYTESSSSLDITMEFPGVTPYAGQPIPLSTDYKEGWYDQSLLRSIVKGSGDDQVSGFKIPTDSQFKIPDTFGPGKTFSRLKTFVISQAPTITMVFKAANATAIKQDFQENASASVSFLGLFSLGSVSESYKVSKVDENSAAGTVTVTLAPPDINGTVPMNAKVAYVLGGVADYPPHA